MLLLAVLALCGDTATGQIEIADIHDNSLALGTSPPTLRVAWSTLPTSSPILGCLEAMCVSTSKAPPSGFGIAKAARDA
jgi:hypothetical protein